MFVIVARPVTVRVLVVVDVAAMKNVLSELTWILDATNMLLARYTSFTKAAIPVVDILERFASV